METRLLFYLLLFFSVFHVIKSITFTTLKPCEETRLEAARIHITFTLTPDQILVEMHNLKKRCNYELAVQNGKTRKLTCKQDFNANSTTMHKTMDISCLTCGIKWISVQDNIPVRRRITKPGCVIPTVPSTSKDYISTTIPSTSKDYISTTIPSTSKDYISTTIPSTSNGSNVTIILPTSKDNNSTNKSSNGLSASEVAILISVPSLVFIAFVSTCFIWCVWRKKKKKFDLPPNENLSPNNSNNTENPGSSNLQGLVICCPCNEVHREATKEFLSLINNFTDLHATSYLDLRLCEKEAIPQLVQELCDKASWIIVIESANFYYHSKDQDFKTFHLCSLMTYFSVQLLKYSAKAEGKNLKTIYRISFDLEFKEFELSQVFPGLNGHIYSLLMQSMSLGSCLNFDEIERFFEKVTDEQFGKSDKNIRRWTNNNWKESTEAKNLEQALVNRMDETWNSSGCHFIDESYFSAGKSFFHPNTSCYFPWNLKKEEQKYYQTNEIDVISIGNFRNNSLYEYDINSDKQSLINRFPSDLNSEISLKLLRINTETDAKINNIKKAIEEQFDRIEELSV